MFFYSDQGKQSSQFCVCSCFQCEDELNYFISTQWELSHTHTKRHPFLLERGRLWLTKSLHDLNFSAEW